MYPKECAAMTDAEWALRLVALRWSLLVVFGTVTLLTVVTATYRRYSASLDVTWRLPKASSRHGANAGAEDEDMVGEAVVPRSAAHCLAKHLAVSRCSSRSSIDAAMHRMPSVSRFEETEFVNGVLSLVPMETVHCAQALLDSYNYDIQAVNLSTRACVCP